VRGVGARIAELRRAAGLTQEQFAEAINASVQYASRVEVGENLTLHSLAKIADVLDV
jgi:transcriptional regulator with XRE-family HTH domain